MRTLTLLTFLLIYISSTSAIGRCSCQCALGTSQAIQGTFVANSSALCEPACGERPQCNPGDWVFGILDGTWEVISSDTTGCDGQCCLGGTVDLVDMGEIYVGTASALSASSCLGNENLNLNYWPSNKKPLQGFAIGISNSNTFEVDTFITYDKISGKALVSHNAGGMQKLRCVAGPCLDNANVYTPGAATSTSTSTKKVVGYALIWMTLLFIAPKS